jgi:hypothetical protein
MRYYKFQYNLLSRPRTLHHMLLACHQLFLGRVSLLQKIHDFLTRLYHIRYKTNTT